MTKAKTKCEGASSSPGD